MLFPNEPASNGYVYYRISPKADAPLESVIENSAAIYFDFNEPVITNTVFHTLGRDFILTNWTTIPGVAIAWKFYPNPTTTIINLVLEGEVPTGNKTILIYDVQGKLQASYSLEGRTASITTSNWPQGYFQLILLDENHQLLGQGQVLKH